MTPYPRLSPRAARGCCCSPCLPFTGGHSDPWSTATVSADSGFEQLSNAEFLWSHWPSLPYCTVLQEVSADYPTGTEAISQYIDENISEDKYIFLVPMVMNIVQMYYQPQHKFCGLVTRETPLAKKHGETLRTDLFWENTIPDYFIVGGKPPDQFRLEFLELNYGEGTFELEAVLPVYWVNATRPEIPLRSFISISISDPFLHGVLIFRRTDQPAHPPRIGALEAEPYLLF